MLNLHKLIKGNEENCLKASKLGIIDKLLEILDIHSVKTLYPMYSQPLQTYINSFPSSCKDSKLQENVLIWAKRILETDNEMVLFKILLQYYEIIYDFGTIEQDGKPNPLLKDMMENGTLTKLLEIFRNDKYIDWRIKEYDAISIGRLFKAVPLPLDGPEIIKHLKWQVLISNVYQCRHSLKTLPLLAECIQNHDLILEEEFMASANKILEVEKNKNKPDNLINFLKLIINLFKYGILETKEKERMEIEKENDKKKEKQQKSEKKEQKK
ncbi:MAG: hypothetical protein EZS28_001989 [Streblomastix strix]|uniref:Uncharacterized protein n=1 Tax=Streblomastix strix TaxID=222440 RepID=A0A5J4X6T7_9EUKA|nr:MAG: hypothetical protein EZS28_001989 [Streblomastix strix]